MRRREIFKKLAMILVAIVTIVVVDIGTLAIFLSSKGPLNFSNITSSLWFLLMLEGLFIALIGCFMIMPIGGSTGIRTGGGGIPGRYFPSEKSKKTSPYAYDVIAIGILLFVSGLIVSSIGF